MSSTQRMATGPVLGPDASAPIPGSRAPDRWSQRPSWLPARQRRASGPMRRSFTTFAPDMHTRPVSSTRIPYPDHAAAIEAMPPSNALRIVEKILLTDSETAPTISRFPARGAIAQLGERLHGMQEVGGSIPPGSTKFKFPAHRPRRKRRNGFTASPSSRGLGHYPFTVATGVRIPVGTPLFDGPG